MQLDTNVGTVILKQKIQFDINFRPLSFVLHYIIYWPQADLNEI